MILHHRIRKVRTVIRFGKVAPVRHMPEESGMSECRYGCKIYRCPCGKVGVMHNATYGCRTPNTNSIMLDCFSN